MLGVIGEEGESTQQQSKENNSKDETNDEAKESDADNGNTNQEDKVQQPSQVDASQEQRLFISPLARKMADKEDLDITRINGTGGNQRITKLDIQRVLENGYDQADHKSREPQQDTYETANLAAGNVGEGLSPMRKNIAQNMRQSLQNTAQLTLHRKVDADHLLEFKDKLKGELQNAGQDVKLTVTTLLAKAVVLALKDYGAINARYENGTLTEYDDVHLGVATSLEDGLMVPVITQADTKSVGALANEIKQSSEAVREGRTNDVQLQGATFTITNMGASQIEYFTPILNVGETGILGIGALAQEVVMDNGNVKQVSRIPLSLTFDHQILDGAGAAEFLKVLAKYIENPYLLIL